PVTHAGAADAGDRALAHFGRERELQARVQQRRGLAGAGRANDRVPRLLIEEAAVARGFLQQAERVGQLVAHRRDFLRRGGGGGIGGGPGDTGDQRLIVLLAPSIEPEVQPEPDQHHNGDDGGAGDPTVEERQERAEPPDQQGQQDDADEAQEPAGAEEAKDGAHGYSLTSPAKRRRREAPGEDAAKGAALLAAPSSASPISATSPASWARLCCVIIPASAAPLRSVGSARVPPRSRWCPPDRRQPGLRR